MKVCILYHIYFFYSYVECDRRLKINLLYLLSVMVRISYNFLSYNNTNIPCIYFFNAYPPTSLSKLGILGLYLGIITLFLICFYDKFYYVLNISVFEGV